MAVYEVAIAASDFGTGRAQEGDIICVRNPIGEIGLKERNNFIWFLIDTDLDPGELTALGNGTKRRYNIPLSNLVSHGVDLTRVRDKEDAYQPFVSPDSRGKFQSPRSAIDSSTLTVVDREAQ